MRKMLFVCSLLLFSAAQLRAEPLVLEQAGNVLKPKTLEIGLADISYQVDQTKITDSAGTVVFTLTNTALVTPLYARYAVTPVVETFLKLPYSSLNSKSEPAGSASTTSSDSGFADPTIGGKYSFMCKGWDMSGVLILAIPAGKTSSTMPSGFKQGLGVKPLISARKQCGNFIFNGNLSYLMTGEYTDENSVKQDPGDILGLGLGAEMPCKANSDFSWLGEFVYSSLSEAKSASVTQSGTSGARMSLLLGARYNKADLKTKLGFDLSLGDEKFRNYDYRIIAGVTYLINL